MDYGIKPPTLRCSLYCRHVTKRSHVPDSPDVNFVPAGLRWDLNAAWRVLIWAQELATKMNESSLSTTRACWPTGRALHMEAAKPGPPLQSEDEHDIESRHEVRTPAMPV